MFDQTDPSEPTPETRTAREWLRVLSEYREPSALRSSWELAVTVGPFVALWALAWWSMQFSYWLPLGISVLNAAFLLRLFAIQHDCGHRAFFQNRTLGDWIGRVLGVLTLTPYDVWRQQHAVHHGTSGNLDRRGMGDIHTMTVSEYHAQTPVQRLLYRLYRNPIVLFGLGPGWIFLVQNRVPFGLFAQAKYWASAMATNAAILVAVGLIFYFGGAAPLLLIFLPTTLLAATAGMWLFYVQHQFEAAHWDEDEDWEMQHAALHGSSHYVLPKVLQWLSANIGIHHVHHLQSRIPFYRLPEVLADHEVLAKSNRMTIRESLKTVHMHLWDEESRQLMSFRQVRALMREGARPAT